MTSASVSLYFHPLVFSVIHCSLAPTVWSAVFTLPVSLYTYKHVQVNMGTCILRHFLASSTLSLHLLTYSLPLLLSSSGWNLGCIGMSPFITPSFVRRIEESMQTWESVCWGVKDPLSPKPSPVHPTESPDGVIQPSWSLANSYSQTDTQTQRGTQRESQTSSLCS